MCTYEYMRAVATKSPAQKARGRKKKGRHFCRPFWFNSNLL
jgi:hypothetical protein